MRTRFAPSPTGSLHVGGARTALYCLLLARQAGGRFLLRIEDTDQARSTEEAAAGILRDLRWLGLDWDEGPGAAGDAGPWFQSQRLDIYNQHLDALIAQGAVYEAWESREELDALRAAAEADKRSFRYRRVPRTDEEVARFRVEGRTPVLRLAAPDHAVHVHDDVLGEVTVAVDELEDIVVRKADGFPTYHFAVVIDDHLMGVTHVLRGQEHLLNTPKHLGLYEALGWTPPAHGHLPLIANPTGSKMSKRDKAKAARDGARAAAAGRAPGWAWLAELCGRPEDDVAAFMSKQHDGVATAEAIAAALGVELPMIEVMDFRVRGYLPEAVLNYLALLGWSPGDDRELMTMDELIAAFRVDAINKTAARFDVTKLTWLNAETIRRSSVDRLVAAVASWLEVRHSPVAAWSDDLLRRALAVFQPRINTLADLELQAGWVLADPAHYDDKAVAKFLLKGDGTALLAEARVALAALDAWEPAAIEAAVQAVAEARGAGLGKVAQPLRVAVTGAGASPGLGDTLALVGQPATLRRIDAALGRFAGQAT